MSNSKVIELALKRNEWPIICSKCPYCGSNARLDYQVDSDRGIIIYWIVCTLCGAGGPHMRSYTDALTAWDNVREWVNEQPIDYRNCVWGG